MSKQVGKFSLEEIMCPNKIENKEEFTSTCIISDEVQKLISKITQRVGVVAFDRKIIVQKPILDVGTSKIAC